jgi:hypothetical protein
LGWLVLLTFSSPGYSDVVYFLAIIGGGVHGSGGNVPLLLISIGAMVLSELITRLVETAPEVLANEATAKRTAAAAKNAGFESALDTIPSPDANFHLTGPRG